MTRIHLSATHAYILKINSVWSEYLLSYFSFALSSSIHFER